MERREYERINVNARGTFFVRNKGEIVAEFAAKIVDISEKGIRIEAIDESIRRNESLITENSTISFHAMEEFSMFGTNSKQIFRGEAKVVRKIVGENAIVLGCRVPRLSDSADKYLTDRKVSLYIKTLEQII